MNRNNMNNNFSNENVVVPPVMPITGLEPITGGPTMVVTEPLPARNTSEASISQLNSLLRGEISATETYRIALDKVADSDSKANVGLLRSIQEEHGRACQSIRDRIRELGGEASDSSGAWGVWAKTVTSLGSLFGDSTAIKALKEGEEHGLKDFQEALDDVDVSSADLVRLQLIPAQQRHINALDGMLAAMK